MPSFKLLTPAFLENKKFLPTRNDVVLIGEFQKETDEICIFALTKTPNVEHYAQIVKDGKAAFDVNVIEGRLQPYTEAILGGVIAYEACRIFKRRDWHLVNDVNVDAMAGDYCDTLAPTYKRLGISHTL